MLHALFITHGPETCPAAHAETRHLAIDGLDRLDNEGRKLGVSVVGGWADMPGHSLYMIVDAPNAHVISELAMILGFGRWGTVSITALVGMETLHSALRQMAASG